MRKLALKILLSITVIAWRVQQKATRPALWRVQRNAVWVVSAAIMVKAMPRSQILSAVVALLLRYWGPLCNSCKKKLRRNKIYNDYSRKGESKFFCDGSYEPYLWINNSSHAAKYFISPTTAKQRYISFDNLRECLEMKIYLDGGNGSFSVLKMPRIR